MKLSVMAMTGVAAMACLAGTVQAQIQTELFSDSFSGVGRDDTKWRDSLFLDATARFRIVDGKVYLSRNPLLMDTTQQVQWDAKFVRLYNNSDYLQVGGTVRAPHKVRTGTGAYSLGIGLVANNSYFVELAVEDSVTGRTFTIFFEDADTDTRNTLVYDAPQNVTVFDLVIDYDAASDTLGFYWSVPGVDRLFRIGDFVRFDSVGGVAPRRIRPYIIGLMFEDALVPERWRITLDDFYAYREDAP